MKYEVVITKTAYVDVEADSQEEAEQKAEEEVMDFEFETTDIYSKLKRK